MKRILFLILAAVLLLPAAVIVFDMLHEPGSGQASVAVQDAQAQIVLGRYLVNAGNCQGCHTVRAGKPFAGGRAIATPFGDIYASNITPDIDTGIGSWNANDFWRALHNGKSRDGSLLYPAFPYPNYTKVTRADADAMFAYLRTLEPVRQANRANELRFPYNLRPLLAFWRALYFTPGEQKAAAGKSAEWQRGAYLVQGLGHCSACHTSRGALGGSIAEADLAGGMIPMLGWYASSLTGERDSGLGEWDTQDIADLLKTGVSQRGAAFGPMAEVVGGSLQHLAPADINAMATYLKSLPANGATAKPASARLGDGGEAILKQGAKLYEAHCSACHQADGKGAPPGYPPLAGNRALQAAAAVNPVRIVLNGGFAPSTAGNPRPYGMPPFAVTLTDAEVAAVVSYIRNAWGNSAALVTPVDVRRLRGAAVE